MANKTQIQDTETEEFEIIDSRYSQTGYPVPMAAHIYDELSDNPENPNQWNEKLSIAYWTGDSRQRRPGIVWITWAQKQGKIEQMRLYLAKTGNRFRGNIEALEGNLNGSVTLIPTDRITQIPQYSNIARELLNSHGLREFSGFLQQVLTLGRV